MISRQPNCFIKSQKDIDTVSAMAYTINADTVSVMMPNRKERL